VTNYRLPDHAAAESALENTESELYVTRAMLLAFACRAPLVTVTVPGSSYRAILQTHNAFSGKPDKYPGMLLLDGDTPIGPVCDPWHWCDRQFAREPCHNIDVDCRKLAGLIRSIQLSLE